MTTFGDRLRTLREEAQLSQYTLSERSGVPRTMIAGYEQGRNECPTVPVLLKLADALQCSADLLLGREPMPPACQPAPLPVLSLEAKQAQADAAGVRWIEHEGRGYRKRAQGWEPVV